jgi:hypothetical protein
MYFNGRELKEYAEPVKAKDLKIGSVYFALNFVERELITPIIRTWVFIGRNLENEQGLLYFQDIWSYEEGIRYDSASQEVKDKFMYSYEDQTNHIFEFERALDQLMACSLRRSGIRGL